MAYFILLNTVMLGEAVFSMGTNIMWSPIFSQRHSVVVRNNVIQEAE